MKKIISLVLIAILLANLIGCTKKNTIPTYVESLTPDNTKEAITNAISESKKDNNSEENNYETTITRSKGDSLGDVETIIEYGDYSSIAAHYPIFSIEPLDNKIKDTVQTYINNFHYEIKENIYKVERLKSELNIDFKMDILPNNIISLKFEVMENMNYYLHPDTSIKTFIIDLNQEKFLSLEDVFIGEYLTIISGIIADYFSNNETYKDHIQTHMFQETISLIGKSLDKFLLKEDRIILLLPKYKFLPGSIGEEEVEIFYSDLLNYINKDVIKIDNSIIVIPLEPIVDENNFRVKTPNEPLEIFEYKNRKIDSDKPMIALTFDDGPNKKTTIPILDTLKKYNSVGTFFVLGNRVPDNENILKRIIKEGSEIGNHSYNHKRLTGISAEEVHEQIDWTQDTIFKTIGIVPTIMRPTYGSYDDTLKSILDMPMILWSIDTLDWKNRDANKVARHILDNVSNGDIVLMHDIYESTAEAVAIVVPELISRGYQLVTVSELYESKGKILEVGNIYKHVRTKK